jgi:hypothetical protein
MNPWVFDHTALVALFAGNAAAFDLWCTPGGAGVVAPAAAIAEANHTLGEDDDAWRSVLMFNHLSVVPLGEAAAIATGPLFGPLPVRHVVREALQVDGVVVTAAPWQYPPGSVPLRVIQ